MSGASTFNQETENDGSSAKETDHKYDSIPQSIF